MKQETKPEQVEREKQKPIACFIPEEARIWKGNSNTPLIRKPVYVSREEGLEKIGTYGGIITPLEEDYSQECDIAMQRGLPLVVAPDHCLCSVGEPMEFVYRRQKGKKIALSHSSSDIGEYNLPDAVNLLVFLQNTSPSSLVLWEKFTKEVRAPKSIERAFDKIGYGWGGPSSLYKLMRKYGTLSSEEQLVDRFSEQDLSLRDLEQTSKGSRTLDLLKGRKQKIEQKRDVLRPEQFMFECYLFGELVSALKSSEEILGNPNSSPEADERILTWCAKEIEKADAYQNPQRERTELQGGKRK